MTDIQQSVCLLSTPFFLPLLTYDRITALPAALRPSHVLRPRSITLKSNIKDYCRLPQPTSYTCPTASNVWKKPLKPWTTQWYKDSPRLKRNFPRLKRNSPRLRRILPWLRRVWPGLTRPKMLTEPVRKTCLLKLTLLIHPGLNSVVAFLDPANNRGM